MSGSDIIKDQVTDFISDLDFPGPADTEQGAVTPPEVPPVQTPAVPPEETQQTPAEPPVAAPPSQQEPTQVPQVEAPQQAVPQAQVPQTPQVPQAPVQQEPVQETTEQRLARENNELRNMLNELAMGQMGTQPQATVPAAAVQATATQPTAQTQPQVQPQASESDLGFNPTQVVPFLQNDVQFDEVVKDHKNMNALLTAVRNSAVEHMLRILPKATINLVKQQSVIQQATTEFYRLNEDLIPFKPFVGFVTNKVASEHPDWSLESILVETEKRSREQLRLAKVSGQMPGGTPTNTQSQAQGTERTPGRNPGFVPSGPSGRRGSVGGPKDAGMAAQVADLLE